MLKFGFLLALALSALLAACGGVDSATPTATPKPTATPDVITPTPPTPTCENPNLEISVKGDALGFDPDRLQVPAGTEVVLCFTNISSFSQHNWVLVQQGTGNDVAKRGLEAGPDNDYIQPGDPDVIAHTRLVRPRQQAEVRFATPKPGSYQFVCTFPGHNFTMFGDFVVTP